MAKEGYIQVKYSFNGEQIFLEDIPQSQYKTFKEAFFNNEVFVIKYDKGYEHAGPFGNSCNEKYIDMSKVVWIGY